MKKDYSLRIRHINRIKCLSISNGTLFYSKQITALHVLTFCWLRIPSFVRLLNTRFYLSDTFIFRL